VWSVRSSRQGEGAVEENIEFKFCPEDWYTPNTYDANFKDPGNQPGVYLIVLTNRDRFGRFINPAIYEVLYVGSAQNLKVRYQKHEVLRTLREVYGYVQFFFKEEPDFRNKEKALIKAVQPRFNKQWR